MSDDHLEEHTAVADAASMRARCAALEACLRDLLAPRARALLGVGG